MRNTATDLTEGTPWKIIMRFSIPLFFTFLLQQFYNMVDTIVVGQFLGKDALAGVGSTGAINFMIIGFCMGLANGFVIPVAQRYGAKDYKDMRRFVANSIWLTAFFAAIMSITVCILCRSVLIAMKTPADILDLAYDYIFIIFAGIPITLAYNLLTGIIRSLGDSKSPLIFLLICAALVLGMSVFFRVAKIEVVGNSIYTAEEVVEASGIGTGDNLFFINRFSAASRIFSKLPYVDKAKVTRALPNRVTITIQESSAMAYVQADGGYWVLDQNCKLLKSVTESELTGLARVDGITPVEPKVGEVLNAGEADAPKVTYLAAILGQLLTRDMASKVTVIDLSDASNPGFTYDGRFTVRLGANENVEYKFGMLQSAVSQLTASDAGTIDLSIDKRAHFSPG